MPSPLVILTGASGVGKTTIADAIEKLDPEVAVYQGDKIGLPPEEILAGYGPANGPGGASQRGFALYWIGRIFQNPRPVLLETQCRVAFLEEALLLHRISWARIILLECDDSTREARLIHDRQQPELANEDMANWSRYLHREAAEAGYEILDTGAVPLAQTIDHIRSYLRRV
jgi:ABC-type dipeptide/oligopeptide/nickel transport system ATPase component